LTRYGGHTCHISSSILAQWSSDGDEKDVSSCHGSSHVSAKGEPSSDAANHLFESGLEKRYIAGPETGDLRLVVIETGYGVANLRQAGTRDETHVTRSHYGDIQLFPIQARCRSMSHSSQTPVHIHYC
jgi:hypothetical protein